MIALYGGTFYEVDGDTYKIIMAASRDAGNRSMRAAGRTAWAVEDWNAACDECERLTISLGQTKELTQ